MFTFYSSCTRYCSQKCVCLFHSEAKDYGFVNPAAVSGAEMDSSISRTPGAVRAFLVHNTINSFLSIYIIGNHYDL